MFRDERQTLIMQILEQRGRVRVRDLAQQLQVDPVTIRRDLNSMEAQGLLHRVHGGAIYREIRYEQRLPPDPIVTRIAEAAARLIPEGSVIFIGPGDLPGEIVPFLSEHYDLTIITNALNVAWNVAQHQRHTLHILGGQMGSNYGIYGPAEQLRHVRADRLIIGAQGLDAVRGLTHDKQEVVTMTRELFTLGAQVMVLLRPEQVGHSGALFIAPASAVDALVTGREAATPPLWDLSESGVNIILT